VQKVAVTVAAEGSDRRTFFISVIYGLWTLIAAALALPAVVYLFLPPKLRKEPEWVEAGDISRLEPSVPLELVFRRNRRDGWKVISEKSTVWVVKLPDGIVAYGPQCTHLACAYHWEEDKRHFVCPCHTSVFSIDGKVVSGPAPRPLDRYETKVDKSKLLLGPLTETMEITE
jgi:Rieske Fe-S protein